MFFYLLWVAVVAYFFLAASSKSLGNPRKYCRIKNIPNPPNNAGSISAWYVSIKFNSRIRKNNGIIFTCGGISIVIKIIKNNAFLYLKLSLANAYPASDAKITCPIVVIVATRRLLITMKYFPTQEEFFTQI